MSRTGFSYLVLGFTGKKANQFKLAYIGQFVTHSQTETTYWMKTYSAVVDNKTVVILSQRDMSYLELSKFVIEKFGRYRVGRVSKGVLDDKRQIQEELHRSGQHSAGFDQ